jgi:putative ABC transport system substrate-binding protein
VGRVDALYVPTDNTVVAAVGFNYYDVGRQTGAMVARILAGEAPGDIPEVVVAEAARVIR